MLHTHSYCNKRAIKFLVPLTLFLPFEELCHLQILYAVLCMGGTGGNVTAQESHIVTNSTFFSLRNPNSHLKTNRTCNCHQKFSNLTPRVLTDKNYTVEATITAISENCYCQSHRCLTGIAPSKNSTTPRALPRTHSLSIQLSHKWGGRGKNNNNKTTEHLLKL